MFAKYSAARALLELFNAGAGEDDDGPALYRALLATEAAIAATPARNHQALVEKALVLQRIVMDQHADGLDHDGLACVLVHSILRDLRTIEAELASRLEAHPTARTQPWAR